ncbi:MAG: hypothetical protein JWQ95_5637 [Sphaerisporangium sp.]|nr:hypothetical protein [Sphaerisporangium sp.]
MLPRFDLLRPTTVAEAVGCLSEESVPYCGGTELLLAMRAGLYRPSALVDIKRVPELRGIRLRDGVLSIGAATSHRVVALDALVRGQLPMLATVEQGVGNARVRAQGSVGGNLCFAEPKSDLATALVAYEASVSLTSAGGTREVLVSELIQGAYFADKEPDELLVSIEIPLPGDHDAVYLKYQTMERPTVGVAVMNDRSGRRCRVVVGAVGEVPVVWEGTDPSEVVPDEIAELVDPVVDLTGSARYKRHVTAVYVRRALRALEGSHPS